MGFEPITFAIPVIFSLGYVPVNTPPSLSENFFLNYFKFVSALQ